MHLNRKDFRSAYIELPLTIDKAVKANGVPLKALQKVSDHVQGLIEFIIIQVADVLNVDNRLNLQPRQVPFIAREIIEMHGTKITIEDVGICLKRGALGRYDDKLLRLDAAIILPWFDKYYEEKLAEIERQMYEEREAHQKSLPPPKVVDQETALRYIEQWRRVVEQSPLTRPSRPLSAKQIKEEGQIKPKGQEEIQTRATGLHPYSPAEVLRIAELKAQYGRECTDLYSGKVLPGKPTFEEWIKLQ